MNRVRLLINKYHNMSIVAKATLWLVCASFLQKGVALITTPLFTRLMPADQYGQVTAYNAWLEIFTILVTLRLDWDVLNKGMHKFKDDRDGYVSTMQTITFVLACTVLTVYLLFREQFNSLTGLPTIVMTAMLCELMVTPSVSFWTLRKRYEYQYRQVVLRIAGMVILSALLGLAVVWRAEEKGYARILSIVFVKLCFGIPIFIYNRRRSDIWFKLEYAVFALKFNLRLLLHYVSQYVLEHFDRIMIQKMVGFAAAGIYGVAYNAGMLLKMVTQAITNALIPWMYERLEKKEFRQLDDVLFLVYLIVGGVMLTFIAFAPELMMLLADERFWDGVYVIPPVVIGLFFLFVYNTIANVEFFYEQTKFTSYISMVGAVLNVVLNYFGIRMYGYVAAAYTTMICYMFFCVSHYTYTIGCVKKLLQLQTVFQVGRIVLLSGVILFLGILSTFTYEMPIVRYSVVVGMFAMAYWKRNRLQTMVKTIRTAKKKK